MPNLAEIYPEVNNESSVLNNEDNFPTLDLLTVEVIRQQPFPSNSTIGMSTRRKRVALRQTQHNSCQTIKTEVSIKDLNLEETVLYPTSFTTVTCKGSCHKHQVNIHCPNFFQESILDPFWGPNGYKFKFNLNANSI